MFQKMSEWGNFELIDVGLAVHNSGISNESASQSILIHLILLSSTLSFDKFAQKVKFVLNFN
jgi:hypothetical protein